MFGSDPYDPDSTPADGAQGGTARPIKITRFQGRLNLAKFYQDSIQITGSFPIDAGKPALSQTLILSVGGILAKIPLDSHGRGSDGLNIAKLRIKQTKGEVPAQGVPFTIKMTKGDYAFDLADEGVVIDKALKNKAVRIDVLMLFQKSVYQTSIDTLYTSVPEHSASLKLPPRKPAPKN